jgi:glycosyltransferase involved in cell wall biosynthesis
LNLNIIAWPKRKNEKDNPFQSLLYKALEQMKSVQVTEFAPSKIILTKGTKILHIHWPDVFLATAKGWRFWAKLAFLRVLFALTRLLGIPVVWTAHNLKRTGQRNAARLETYFWPWFTKRLDGIIYMTVASKRNAEELFEHWCDIPNAIIPHGHYGPVIAAVSSAPSSIIADKAQFLFFGSITKYKNAYKLLNAFLSLPIGMATLVIKGRMSGTSPDIQLLQGLNDIPYNQKADVIFENRFLDDNELVQAIRESELVVFPYSDVLNSGAAIFALSVGRPILASDTPLFRELQAQVGQNWVRLIDGEIDGAQLALAIKHACVLKRSGQAPDLSKFEWDNIAKQTLAFYRHVLESGSQNKK